jgi:N-acyl amino acid synthase of PEP-CTERM/exosortase system
MRMKRMLRHHVRAALSASKAEVLTRAYHRCFDIIEADSDALRERVFRLRYRVFCVENPFEDPLEHPDKLERDAYDARSHHILLRHRGSGEEAGTIRVVMPDAASPMHSFPLQAACRHPFLARAEHVPRLCEISRLCISASFRRRHRDGPVYSSLDADSARSRGNAGSRFLTRRVIPYAAMGLFKGAFKTVLELGGVDCIAVMEPRLICSIAATGFCCENIGGPIEFHGTRQPVIFNLRQVYEHGRRTGSLFYPLMADRGRLYALALKNEREHGSVMAGFLAGQALAATA